MANEVKIKISAQDEASQKIDKVADSVGDLGGSKVTGAFAAATTASTAFAAGLAAVAGGMAVVGGAMLKQAGSFEQTKIGFTTMLGSAQAAEDKLRELSDFAIKTPFTLPGVETAAKKLLAMGFSADELLPTLKDVGDVASGLGLRQDGFDRLILNLGQVRTQGKLTGRDLRDFAINGVPLIGELADMLGVAKNAIADMVSEGAISDKMVTEAFRRMASEGGKFANLMDKQSQSMLGMWSNLQDSVTRFMREAGMPLLENFAKPVLAWALRAVEILPMVADKFLALGRWFAEHKVAIAAVVGLIIGGLTPAFVALAGLFMTFVIPAIAAGVAALTPFLVAGAALGALAYWLYEAYSTNFLGIRDAVTSVLSAIQAVVQAFTDFMILIWQNNILGIQDIVFNGWETIKLTLGSALDIILGMVRVITGLLSGDWEMMFIGMQFVAENVLELISNLFVGILTGILQFIRLSLTAMVTLIGDGLNLIAKAFSIVWSNIGIFVGQIWENMLNFIAENIPIIGDFIANSADFIAGAFRKMFGGVGSIVAGIFGGIVNIVIRAINWIIDKINIVLSWLRLIPKKFGGIDIGDLSKIDEVQLTAPDVDTTDVAKPELPELPKFEVPTFGGGEGSGGSDKKSDLEKQIEQNIKDLGSDRSDLASRKETITKTIEKIDEELARERREGREVNQELLDQRNKFEQERTSLTNEINRIDERLKNSQEDLAIEQRERIKAQDEKDQLEQDIRGVDDIIAQQKIDESAADKAAKEAEKAAKEKNKTSSTSSSSSISSGSSPLSTIAQLQGQALEAGAVVILDQGSGGETHYNIEIHDNHFYGDEEGFAEKIGNSIVERLSIHTAFPSS